MTLIYVIEDDPSLRFELEHLLGLHGFQTKFCADFSAAAREALASRPDCVLLDLKLPGTDGLSICRSINAADTGIPIIILTSSDSEFDEVMGMSLGADDYISKPYSPAVLMAHLHSVLRRRSQPRNMRLSHRGVELDAGAGSVSFAGNSAELTRNEHKILHLLMRNPGDVIMRQEIMAELWESDEFVDDNTLTVNVNRLRKTLSSIGVPDDFLVTKRGMGYRV